MDTLAGHPRLQMLITKRIRKGGSLYRILQKVFAGKCCPNKMKLLYGRKLVKRVAIAQGNDAVRAFIKYYFSLCISLETDF